jgi:hypothetical protein
MEKKQLVTTPRHSTRKVSVHHGGDHKEVGHGEELAVVHRNGAGHGPEQGQNVQDIEEEKGEELGVNKAQHAEQHEQGVVAHERLRHPRTRRTQPQNKARV